MTSENRAVPTGLSLIFYFTQRLTAPIHAKAARLGDPGARWAKLFRPSGWVLRNLSTMPTQTSLSYAEDLTITTATDNWQLATDN